MLTKQHCNKGSDQPKIQVSVYTSIHLHITLKAKAVPYLTISQKETYTGEKDKDLVLSQIIRLPRNKTLSYIIHALHAAVLFL